MGIFSPFLGDDNNDKSNSDGNGLLSGAVKSFNKYKDAPTPTPMAAPLNAGTPGGTGGVDSVSAQAPATTWLDRLQSSNGWAHIPAPIQDLIGSLHNHLANGGAMPGMSKPPQAMAPQPNVGKMPLSLPPQAAPQAAPQVAPQAATPPAPTQPQDADSLLPKLPPQAIMPQTQPDVSNPLMSLLPPQAIMPQSQPDTSNPLMSLLPPQAFNI